MPKERRKVSAVLSDFISELNRLRRFDSQNQTNFTENNLSNIQLYFLTESVFFGLFRAYESLVRDLFLLYCLEKETKSGKSVHSYLNPKNFLHAEELLKSNLRFLDWSSPDTIIDRAKIYLKDGFPIKTPVASNRIKLIELKRIRNQIAHDSRPSFSQYKKVIRNYYSTVPLNVPRPGKLLLRPVQRNTSIYILLEYFDLLENVAITMSN